LLTTYDASELVSEYQTDDLSNLKNKIINNTAQTFKI